MISNPEHRLLWLLRRTRANVLLELLGLADARFNQMGNFLVRHWHVSTIVRRLAAKCFIDEAWNIRVRLVSMCDVHRSCIQMNSRIALFILYVFDF